MKWVCSLVFWVFVMAGGEAQVFHSPVKSAYLTGGAYSAHFTDAFSFTGNPAVLGSAKTFCMAVSSERRWMLKELEYYRMACSFSAGRGGIGFQFHYTGNFGYNETAFAISYGKDLGIIMLGLQFRYDIDHVAGYDNKTDGSAMLGLRFHPSEKVYAGFVFSASFFGRAGKIKSEKGSGNYNMGFGYEASSFVFLSVQMEKEAGIPLNIIGSVDYRWSDQFYAAMGIAGISTSPYLKAGWKKNQLTIEIFTAYQAELGFTPGLVLLWEGKNKPG
jgi:hypothetical protein